MKKYLALLVSFLAMQSHAAPSDSSSQWNTLVKKLETIQLGMDSALSLRAPIPSLAHEISPAPCSGRGSDGRCDTLDATIMPVAAYQAADVKKYHRDSAEAVVKTHEGIDTSLDLVLEASKNPDFSEQDKSALRALHFDTSRSYSYLPLLRSHEIYSKQVAEMSGSLDMGDSKKYRNLMGQTSDALEADRQTMKKIIAQVKTIGGISDSDGRYFTDLKVFDDRHVVIMVFRDIPGHEKEIEGMATNAVLVTRKTQFTPTFNMRKVIYLKDPKALSPELKKQWFQDDEKIVAVSLGFGEGTSREIAGRYSLEHFRTFYDGRTQVSNLRLEIAFLKAHGMPVK